MFYFYGHLFKWSINLVKCSKFIAQKIDFESIKIVYPAQTIDIAVSLWRTSRPVGEFRFAVDEVCNTAAD